MPTAGFGTVGNLPAQWSSFVGRAREVAEVEKLLSEFRLVTLTGMGGSGKTRLALRVAADMQRAFGDGAWLVDLTFHRESGLLTENIEDPDVLVFLVRAALGLREQGIGTPLEVLVEQLANREMLLVLDNCEHLMPAVAVLAAALLGGCPRLRVLATSREPLLIAGERLFAVPPLPTPDPSQWGSPEATARSEAVALFLDRAQAAAPDFQPIEGDQVAVAELCHRLDGLPLAIELAAARVPVLSPEQILKRLTDRFALLSRGNRGAPERQQTLRACVAWSFELCSKPERLLWARSSVFAGGFELDAVEGVCTDEKLPAEELLDVLAGLVDKSILVRDDVGGETARYRMLETLRDYGQDELIELEQEDQLRGRHRDWYTDLARRFEAEWLSSRQPAWLARLDREVANLRAALEFSVADPDGVEAALAIPASLAFYWALRGRHREGRSWADQALAESGGPTLTRLKALYASAALAIPLGDLPAARARVRQADEVAAQRGDALGYAFADTIRGNTELGGDLVEAEHAWQRAAARFAAEPGDEYLMWRVCAHGALAMFRAMQGDTAGAAAGHEAVLAICEPRGEMFYTGFSLWSLGLGLWKQGDLPGADARIREGVQRLRTVNDTVGTILSLDTLACIAYDEGQPERAAALLGAVTALAHAMGGRPALFPELAAYHEQYEQRTREALGEPAYQDAFTRGERMSPDEAVAYALDEP